MILSTKKFLVILIIHIFYHQKFYISQKNKDAIYQSNLILHNKLNEKHGNVFTITLIYALMLSKLDVLRNKRLFSINFEILYLNSLFGFNDYWDYERLIRKEIIAALTYYQMNKLNSEIL